LLDRRQSGTARKIDSGREGKEPKKEGGDPGAFWGRGSCQTGRKYRETREGNKLFHINGKAQFIQKKTFQELIKNQRTLKRKKGKGWE